MPAATIADFQTSVLADISLADETIASITWQTGDVVVVFGLGESEAFTLGTPVRAGLTFSLVDTSSGSSNGYIRMWKSTPAAAGGSGTIALAQGGGGGAGMRVAVAYVLRGVASIGTPAKINGSAAKVVALTRASANSLVLEAFVDWNSVNDVVVTATPTGTVRVAVNTAQATMFVLDFPDQGAAGGPTSYGLANHTGTVKMAGMVVEVVGSATVPPKQMAVLGVG